MELTFEVHEAEEGGFVARASGYSIFTEAETWDELRHMVREATALHFEGEVERPQMIRLHLVKDEFV